MPKILGYEVECLIKHFYNGGFSHRKIADKLKGSGFVVSRTSVSRVLNNVGKKRQQKSAGLSSPTKVQPSLKLNPPVLKKINCLISRENPPTQKFIAKSCGV